MKQMGAKSGNVKVKTHRDLQKGLYAYMDTQLNTQWREGGTEGGTDGRLRTSEQGFQRAPSISSQAHRYDANKIHLKRRYRNEAEEREEELRFGTECSCCSHSKMDTISCTVTVLIVRVTL